MCKIDSQQVSSHLRSKDTYSSSKAFELCVQYNIIDGKVFLLEKEGKIKEAYEILKSELDLKISILLKQLNETENKLSVQWTSLNTNLVIVITFCQRVSHLIRLSEREELWCSLLELFVTPLKNLHEKSVVSKWREMVRHVISSMLGYVSHQKVVAAVLDDPGYSEGSWSELKQLLGELLDTFRYY